MSKHKDDMPIPEDIMQMAREVAAELVIERNRAHLTGRAILAGEWDDCTVLSAARAILAERQRCATVAATLPYRQFPGRLLAAAAILTPSTVKTEA